MKRDQMLELRVLNGTHAGARVVLPDSPQVIGSDDGCDLILCDDGIEAVHARIECAPEGTVTVHWEDAARVPVVLRPGQGLMLGPVRIAIEPADAPWRDDVALAQAPLADMPSASDEAQQQAHGHETEPLAPPAAAVPQPVRTRWRAVGLALLLAAGVAGMGWLAWRALSGDATRPPARSAAPPDMPEESLARTVATLGLGSRVRVTAGPGTPAVEAAFLSDGEAEALAATLSRLSPRPRLLILSEQEALAALQEALQRETDTLSGPTLTHRGGGHLLLQGRIADESRGAAVLERLRRAFPLVASLEADLETAEQAGNAFVMELKALGVDISSSEWNGHFMSLEAKIPDNARDRWERQLAAAAARHPVAFRANVTLVAAPDRAATLPFQIRSVTDTATPYLTLADGRRLVAGGRVDGWRLRSIGARSLVFEQDQGARLILER